MSRGTVSGRLARAWPTLPLALGGLQALVGAALVLIELAQPAPRPGFEGIAFSNAVASERARAAVELFRERLDWPGAAAGRPRSLSPAGYLAAKRAGVVALALLQVGAVLACLRRRRGAVEERVWPWLVGPVMTLSVLVAMPPVSTDVFYYAAAGNLAAVGINPYLVAPLDVAAGDPFAPFNDWAHIATPYGPVWTALSRLVIAVTGPDPFRAALGLKVVAAGSALGLALVTAWLARRLGVRPCWVCAAVVLVAWQPVLVLESAGSAHLDATMMLPAVGGLAAIASGTRGGVRGGLVLIAAGALIKPVAAPLLGLAALWRLVDARRRLDGPTTMVRHWLGDMAAVAAVVALAFAPYWSGGDLWRTLSGESKRLYLDEALGVNPFWFWLLPRLPLVPEGDPWLEIADRVVRPATALIMVGLIVCAWLWLAARWWPWTGPHRAARRCRVGPAAALRGEVQAWAVATVALGLLPVNAHAWYAIWPLAPVALAWVATARCHPRRLAGAAETDAELPPWRAVPWWLWLFPIWSTGSFLVYHTHVVAELPSP